MRGSRVLPNSGAPRLQVLQSPGLASRRPWFCNLCAAASVFLTAGSKSFPPRRDARNANNQPSAPAWTGLAGRRGAPGPSRVHPRAGPGGDTKKPGTPTPTAGARRDPRGAPPAAKFTAPRAPRCPLPGEVSRGPAGSPASRVSRGPPGVPRRAPGTQQGSCPPLPRPPALAGRFRARGPLLPSSRAHRCLPGREARAGARPALLRAPFASLLRWRPSIALPLALPCCRRLAAQPSALRSGLEAADHAPRLPARPVRRSPTPGAAHWGRSRLPAATATFLRPSKPLQVAGATN